jgi:hypothetical protein
MAAKHNADEALLSERLLREAGWAGRPSPSSLMVATRSGKVDGQPPERFAVLLPIKRDFQFCSFVSFATG